MNLLKICLRIQIGLELSPGQQHHPTMAIACSSLHRDTNLDYHHYPLHYVFAFISVSLGSMGSLLSIYYNFTLHLEDLHLVSAFHWCAM
ncbi:uncharacterized protein K444DRAFT_391931 [Hyaloscypha bicolor E]|uniref:Uncharacterized protein n=1 Tax=Hyaloscypha bicolor E TaxID=1095630 RepID=A0A2J6TBM7_9HELO|nr:uncharacterized protein K444DRAFT_391931 [Hyaloscypha bicolor E]PMD60378.1 hypothetical protein K444DRAFT_391931 [Hyaloscypha bicolor E]